MSQSLALHRWSISAMIETSKTIASLRFEKFRSRSWILLRLSNLERDALHLTGFYVSFFLFLSLIIFVLRHDKRRSRRVAQPGATNYRIPSFRIEFTRPSRLISRPETHPSFLEGDNKLSIAPAACRCISHDATINTTDNLMYGNYLYEESTFLLYHKHCKYLYLFITNM